MLLQHPSGLISNLWLAVLGETVVRLSLAQLRVGRGGRAEDLILLGTSLAQLHAGQGDEMHSGGMLAGLARLGIA